MFCITGEKDYYNINIADPDNKKKYCYQRDSDDNLILAESDISGGNQETEVLIDSLYGPSIYFEHSANTDPFSLTVAITATAKKIGKEDVIGKRDNIRFRYTKIVE